MLFNRKFRTEKVLKNHGVTPVTNWNDKASVNLKISNRNDPIEEKNEQNFRDPWDNIKSISIFVNGVLKEETKESSAEKIHEENQDLTHHDKMAENLKETKSWKHSGKIMKH